MKTKVSPKESTAVDRVWIPSACQPYVTAHEKAWEREMRHRLAALEQRLDDVEDLIKDLHEKELGV